MLGALAWIRGAGVWLASRLSCGAWAAPSSIGNLPRGLTASFPLSHRLASPFRYSTSLKTGKNKWFFQKLRF